MERRELFRHSMMAMGAGLAGLTPGLSLTRKKKVHPAQLDMLKGQEGVGNPREAHAYAIGMQAFEYGFPLVYMASLSYTFNKDPMGQQVPLNAFISPKDFVATSNFRNGGSFNTDTVYAGAFIDLRKGPMVLTTQDPEGHYFGAVVGPVHQQLCLHQQAFGWTHFWQLPAGPPGWTGKIPKGKFDRVLQCEQKRLFALVRLRIDQDDAAEVTWAKAKFKQAQFTPMDDSLAGRTFTPNDNNVFDVTQFKGNPLRPFAILNHMLIEVPPPAIDEILLQGFKTVHIGPGHGSFQKRPRHPARPGLRRPRRPARAALARRAPVGAVGQWLVLLPTNIGQAKTTDYIMRSAWQSLWASWRTLRVNAPTCGLRRTKMASGSIATASMSLYMRKDQFPKVEAFWSFTMYQELQLGGERRQPLGDS